MIFMVTNRRKRRGRYGDEEQPGFRFDYLFDHRDGPQGNDGFNQTGKKGFELALLREMKRLQASGINTPKVGVYIHGYNNDWQESIDEVLDLEAALSRAVGYAPILVGFSWPSTGSVKNYLTDREEVRDSIGAFTRFLNDINDFLTRNEPHCFATSYCIAHSMGNYLLRKGMEYLSDHLGTPDGRMMFNETVMLAPDISARDIEYDGKGVYISKFSRRVHVYYSKHDRALKASSIKRFGGNRLGRHGPDDYEMLPPNVIAVNAEKYANSKAIKGVKDRSGEQVSVHSSHRYHKVIVEDIKNVLSSIDRELIPNRIEDPKTEPSLRNHFKLA